MWKLKPEVLQHEFYLLLVNKRDFTLGQIKHWGSLSGTDSCWLTGLLLLQALKFMFLFTLISYFMLNRKFTMMVCWEVGGTLTPHPVCIDSGPNNTPWSSCKLAPAGSGSDSSNACVCYLPCIYVISITYLSHTYPINTRYVPTTHPLSIVNVPWKYGTCPPCTP